MLSLCCVITWQEMCPGKTLEKSKCKIQVESTREDLTIAMLLSHAIVLHVSKSGPYSGLLLIHSTFYWGSFPYYFRDISKFSAQVLETAFENIATPERADR